MKIVIAEKPSVAQSLAAVIGATSRKDGYLEGNGWRVSWCVGHLLGWPMPTSITRITSSGAMMICYPAQALADGGEQRQEKAV